jgi:hypothetical protein
MIQTQKIHENMMWFMDVYLCVKVFFFFFSWIFLFHLISLHFYFLKYNITNFTISMHHFLNFETVKWLKS